MEDMTLEDIRNAFQYIEHRLPKIMERIQRLEKIVRELDDRTKEVEFKVQKA